MSEKIQTKRQPKKGKMKRRLPGNSEQPSTSSAASLFPESRSDIDLSKNIFLEVAANLVSEKNIFGKPGRKKFRRTYQDQFPELDLGYFLKI